MVDKTRRKLIKQAFMAMGSHALPKGSILSEALNSANRLLSEGASLPEEHVFLSDYPLYSPDFFGNDIYGEFGHRVGERLRAIALETDEGYSNYKRLGFGGYSNAFRKLSKAPPSNVTIGQIMNPENAQLIEKLGIVSSQLPVNEEKQRGVSLADVSDDFYRGELKKRQALLEHFTGGDPDHYLNNEKTLPEEWAEFLKAYTDNDLLQIQQLKLLSLQKFYDTEIMPIFIEKLERDLKRIFSGSDEKKIINDLGNVFNLTHVSDYKFYKEGVEFAKELLPEFADPMTKYLTQHYEVLHQKELKSVISKVQKKNLKKGVVGETYVLSFDDVNLVRSWIGANLPFYGGIIQQHKNAPNNECFVTTDAPALQMFLDSKSINRQQYGEHRAPALTCM